MRKTAVLVIAVAVTLALGTVVKAQDVGKVTGYVSKKDAETMSVTILPEGGPSVTIFMADAESLSKVYEGDRAEVRYRVNDGKRMGRYIRKIDEEGGCQ
jgi:hypothetical protein